MARSMCRLLQPGSIRPWVRALALTALGRMLVGVSAAKAAVPAIASGVRLSSRAPIAAPPCLTGMR
ncbi:hypothetical protein D3C72_1507250 [compost metagenome]